MKNILTAQRGGKLTEFASAGVANSNGAIEVVYAQTANEARRGTAHKIEKRKTGNGRDGAR